MTLERRFHEMWSALAAIGASSSSSSGVAAGYNRFAWTAVDLELRRWFRDEARAFGLEVEQDRNGNLWAWWDVEDRHAHPGATETAPAVPTAATAAASRSAAACRGHRDRGQRDRGHRDRGHRDRGQRDGAIGPA